MIEESQKSLEAAKESIKLKKSGASSLPGGKLTFPNVNLSTFKGVDIKERDKKLLRDIPVGMNMSYIETSGEVSMLFNKDMVYPEKID